MIYSNNGISISNLYPIYTRFILCEHRLIELDEQNVKEEITKILPFLQPFLSKRFFQTFKTRLMEESVSPLGLVVFNPPPLPPSLRFFFSYGFNSNLCVFGIFSPFSTSFRHSSRYNLIGSIHTLFMGVELVHYKNLKFEFASYTEIYVNRKLRSWR